MIQTNIISTINKILQWPTRLHVPYKKVKKKVQKVHFFEKKKKEPSLLLTELRHKKYLYDSKKEVADFHNENLSDDEKMILKHMAINFVNSLLEMQKDENSLKKLKKDLDIDILKKLMCEVYAKFWIKYDKFYRPNCLNRVRNYIS